MEGKPCDTDRFSKNKRIPDRITEKLGGSNKVNGRNQKEYEEAIQQEKKKSSRIEGWRQHVDRKQEYSLEPTLKEVGSQEIQTF